MVSMKAKWFILKTQMHGEPKETNFEMVEKTLHPLLDKEFLVETLYLSVDPYMRVYSMSLKEGTPMAGGGVGKVIQSKNEDYPEGTLLWGPFGWCTHLIPNSSHLKSNVFKKLPDNIPPSYGIGIFGLTGMTAYFGLLDIAKPQPGETVFVNTAAGAVGNVVMQIAKILGCKVVGCTGGDEKVKYLKDMGFDAVFNYKTVDDLEETMKKLCPKGIDCFFDNVGGEMFDITLKLMNRLGRVVLCGCISIYNSDNQNSSKGPYIHTQAIHKEIKIQGFMTPSYKSRFDEGIQQLSKWMEEGKLQVIEHVVEGFENTPKAFVSLFSGENTGKVVVKV